MSFIKEYIFILVVILLYFDVTWSIGIPKIRSLRIVPSQINHHRVLKCIALGSPRPSISWTFNGKTIEDNGQYDFKNDRSQLIIKYVQPADTGHYRCYAANTFGMIFAQIHLKIVGIGMFEEDYTADDMNRVHNVTIGKEAKIMCPPHTDQAGQTYTWALPPLEFIQPGKPIERAFLSDYHGTLYFSYITADDIELINKKGGVGCLLFVDYNNLRASVKINLQSDGKDSTENFAPEMVVFFKNDTVGVEGEKKEVRCGATGRPHPAFKWYKDGTLISSEDGTKSTLDHVYFDGKGLVMTFMKLKKEDAGTYKCVATNSEGEDYQEANLLIHSKVAWTKELVEKLNVPVKKSVILKCGATGFPEPKYIWYHNNTNITSSLRRKIQDGTMEIAESDFGDCGMYLCTAENYLNTIVSAAYVTIEDVPPAFTKKISGVYYLFLEGNRKLTCQATGGPEPEILWYKDGTLIVNSERMTVTADGTTLIFKNVTKEQNGVYKCVAKNREASVESSAEVKVYKQTRITKRPDKVRYKAGYSAYLFCDAVYDDTLTITWQWLKDGVVIVYDDNVYLKDKDRIDGKRLTHTLKVKEVRPEDGGNYTCRVLAADGGGSFSTEDSASGSVTVIAPPLMVANLKLTGSFSKDKKDPKKQGDSGDGKTDPTKDPSTTGGDKTTDPTSEPSKDDDVVLSWDPPSKYVGPAEKFIIEYAKANSSDWVQYDPPKKYEGTSVKLEKDKLPADSDLVFRIKAISTDPRNGKEMVGEPSNATEPGLLVTPTRAPKSKPSNVRLEKKDDDDDNVTIAWDKVDEVDRPGPGFKTVGKFREIKPKESDYTEFEKDGDENSVPGPAPSDDGVDREYEVLVANKNDKGQGPWQRSILKVPGTKPTKTVDGVELVEVTSKGAKIKWLPVAGASKYRIFYTKKDSRRRRRRSAQATLDVDDTKATIIDLKPGAEYEITVAVLNLKGAGPPSAPLDVATKGGVPGIPNDVTLDTYADTVKLGWSPPPEKPEVKNYTVTWYPKDDPTKKKTKVISGDEREAFITDDSMDPQAYYTVEIAANSDDGQGDPWVMEGVVIGPPDVPGKPAPPLTDAVNETKINVTFRLPPSYIGGLPKKIYICYQTDKCFTSEYPKKPYVVVDSLDHSRTYEFWSYAENDKGTGEKSDKVSQKPLDPPTTIPPTTTTTTPPPTNVTVVVAGSTFSEDKAFYEELWFIILLIILLILIIILIILCIICNRRGGKYPVGKKEKEYGGWDKDPMKDYSDNAMENGGADLPLISPTRSPDRDSLKKPPFDDDDDEDSLADYGEGYGDMDQYGTDKKEKNGQTVC